MKKYSRVFSYLKTHIPKILLYFLFTVLSIFFSIISIGMLMPFLELIFNVGSGTLSELTNQSSNPILNFIRGILTNSINQHGKLNTLAVVCGFIIASVFLKNLFLYLSS